MQLVVGLVVLWCSVYWVFCYDFVVSVLIVFVMQMIIIIKVVCLGVVIVIIFLVVSIIVVVNCVGVIVCSVSVVGLVVGVWYSDQFLNRVDVVVVYMYSIFVRNICLLYEVVDEFVY